MTYGKDKRIYYFPDWAILVGWVISTIPLFLLPALIVYNLVKFRIQGRVILFVLVLPKIVTFSHVPNFSSYNQSGRLMSGL